MKKIFLIIILILLVYSFSFSIPKPKKNTPVGALTGRIEVEILNSSANTTAGKYHNNIKLYLYNVDTNKEVTAFTGYNNDGYFYILNMAPGNYVFWYFVFIYEGRGATYTLPFASTEIEEGKKRTNDDAINFTIEENKITAMNKMAYQFLFVDDPIDPGRFKAVLKKINFTDELTGIKEYFQKKDRKNDWKDFEWKTINNKQKEGK